MCGLLSWTKEQPEGWYFKHTTCDSRRMQVGLCLGPSSWLGCGRFHSNHHLTIWTPLNLLTIDLLPLMQGSHWPCGWFSASVPKHVGILETNCPLIRTSGAGSTNQTAFLGKEQPGRCQQHSRGDEWVMGPHCHVLSSFTSLLLE